MNIFISFIFQAVIFGSWDIQDISLEYGQRAGVKFNSLKKFLTVPYILMSLWEWSILQKKPRRITLDHCLDDSVDRQLPNIFQKNDESMYIDDLRLLS